MSSPRPRVLPVNDDAGILRVPALVVIVIRRGGRIFRTSGRRSTPPHSSNRHVIVVDLFMPERRRLEAFQHLKEQVPRRGSLWSSAADDAPIREKALRAAASAFVAKIRAADDSVPAIHEATVS